jgi:predicted RecB family nuclease
MELEEVGLEGVIPTKRRVSTGRLRGRNNEWVSKTDLTRYLRCPYSFWLLSTGQIRKSELVDDHVARLIAEGDRFDKSQRAAGTPIEVENLEDLFAHGGRVLQNDRFENPVLKIVGVPDGIDPAEGGLVPIEMKSHRRVHHSDRLELAFYWLLLEPVRTKVIEPRGVLLLRDGDSPTPKEELVGLTPALFDEVQGLIGEVRRVKNAKEMLPEICDCTYCRAHQAEIEAKTPRSDLSRIWGIGPAYRRHLQSIGILNLEQLKACNPAAVSASMKARKWGVSARMVESWIRHAESYDRGGPIVFGPAAIPESYIALDLEYLPDHVWLIGGCVVDGSSRSDFAWWSDSTAEEAANLNRLRELMNANPGKPLMTWAGLSADIPHVRSALGRCGGDDRFLDDHVDLYQVACKSIRLPLAGMGLKAVAQYFQLTRASDVVGGLQAQLMYQEYRGARRRRRRALTRDLLAYNKDDIDTLVKELARLTLIVLPPNERELVEACREP